MRSEPGSNNVMKEFGFADPDVARGLVVLGIWTKVSSRPVKALTGPTSGFAKLKWCSHQGQWCDPSCLRRVQLSLLNVKASAMSGADIDSPPAAAVNAPLLSRHSCTCS